MQLDIADSGTLDECWFSDGGGGGYWSHPVGVVHGEGGTHV